MRPRRIFLAIAAAVIAIPLLTGLLVLVYPSAMDFHPLFQQFLSLQDSEALYFAFVTRIADIVEVNPKRLYRLRPNARCSLRMQCDENVVPPIQVCTSNEGYRISCLQSPTEQTNAWEVLVVGDSNTFGWCLPYEKTWARRLEHHLKESTGVPIRVTNGGVFGYTSVHALIALKEALARQPNRFDAVVFWAGRNDVNHAYQRTTESWVQWLESHEGKKAVTRGENRLYRFWNLNRLLVSSAVELVFSNQNSKAQVPKKDFGRNVEEVRDLLLDRGIHAVFLSYEPSDDYAISESIIDADAKLIRPFDTLSQLKAPDGDPEDARWFHFVGDEHLNEAGAEVFAQILAERISPWVTEQNTGMKIMGND